MRQEKKKKEGVGPLQKRWGLRPAATGGGACYRGDSIHRSGQASRGAADSWEGSESGRTRENFLWWLVTNQREDGGKEKETKMERRGEEREDRKEKVMEGAKKAKFFF